MKKKMLSIVLFGLVLLVSPLLQAQAADKVYKIRFTAYWPPAHHLIKTAELLAKNVQARTNGRLVVEVYPSAQLYSQKESLKAVAMGSVEMADELMAKAENVDPLFGVDMNNLYILTDYDIAWAYLDKPLFRKIIGDVYEKKLGVKPLLYPASGMTGLLVNSKRPVVNAKDVKDMLIRVANKGAAGMVECMGAKPVLMSSGEQILALQRGTVDGARTSLGDGVSRRIWEVSKYATVFMPYVITHPFIINLKYYNSLPEDLRGQLMASARDAEAWARKILEEQEKEYLATLKSHMPVHVQTDQEAEEWEKIFTPLTQSWLKKTGEKGKALRDLMFETRKEVLAKRK
jgi:C4-dicarboxylate-binding protein DctP